MLTGHVPRNFSQYPNEQDVYDKAPIPIRKHKSNIPKQLAEIIDEILAGEGRENKIDKYHISQSALALMIELRKFK
jgi:hypothetical protein